MRTLSVNTRFFEFESDFVDSLRCVPMIVRYKLDTCGIKLKLPEWAKFNVKHKEMLACMRCYTATEIENYRSFVQSLVYTYTGHEASILGQVNDSWNNIFEVPEEVILKGEEWKCPKISIRNWINLDTLQRFALVKLSRSGHEGRNFPVALREFGVV
ncbi:nitrate reductase associated protein [Dyadobacter sp. CY312]|uniref:nitrate reductase associated protein n=1 Tax=Dyadobacter sp. CY312 TaxID=2907303 RepID=UPI001F2DFE65|nr:nitrate reductase associated protein [Dyadobacter sp. CY312]MCE7040547.1 nitrate reductase associated protein [Dyadobacter sp. CY312]